MAYRCDGNDSSNKMPKYVRTKNGCETLIIGMIKTKRIINTGVRVSGSGNARPLTGQLYPRGS
jgi:hypothetical protein